MASLIHGLVGMVSAAVFAGHPGEPAAAVSALPAVTFSCGQARDAVSPAVTLLPTGLPDRELLPAYVRTCAAIEATLERHVVRVEPCGEECAPRRDGSSNYVDRVTFSGDPIQSSDIVRFPGLRTSYRAYPELLDVLLTHLPRSVNAVEVHLPPPVLGRCPTRAPQLANAKVSQALTVVMPEGGPDERRLGGLCLADDGGTVDPMQEPPIILFTGVEFERRVRFLFPAEPAIGLALTASRFRSTMEVDAAPPAKDGPAGTRDPAATLPPLPLPRLTINATVLEADTFIANVNLRGVNLYFNKANSVTIASLTAAQTLWVHDNQTGPLRLRNLLAPTDFRIEANKVSDSLYLTEIRLPAAVAQPGVRVPSVLHNHIDGNLVVSLLSASPTLQAGDGLMVPRLRIGSTNVGGSAYLLFGQGTAAGPACEAMTAVSRLGPARLELTDSRIASQLVIGMARYAAYYPGSSYCVLRAVAPAPVADFACHASPELAAMDRNRFVDVDLTGSKAGVLAWNLPACSAADGLEYVWSGSGFRFERFEHRPLSGDPPVPEPRQDARSASIALLDGLRHWAGRHRGEDTDLYAALEEYTARSGNVFGSWEMKGSKVLNNLLANGRAQWTTQKELLHEVAALSVGRAFAAEPGGGGAAGGQRNAPQVMFDALVGFLKLLLVGVVLIWGAPALYGAHPELAFAILVVIVLGFAVAYSLYSRHCARRDWSALAALARATAPDGGVRWSDLAGQEHHNGYFSRTPGFLQKDPQPWRRLSFFWLSIDCTVPLVDFNMRDEYQPYDDVSLLGRIVHYGPAVQRFCGIWLGSWAVAIFLI